MSNLIRGLINKGHKTILFQNFNFLNLHIITENNQTGKVRPTIMLQVL
jgi:hypothetical protein